MVAQQFAGTFFRWTPRHVRQRDIAEATAEHRESSRRLAQTQRAVEDFQEAVYGRNHITDAVAQTLGVSPEAYRAYLRRGKK